MRKEHIHKEIQNIQHNTPICGIYFTCYDQNNTIIISKGVAQTDKEIPKTIDILYHSLIEPVQQKINYIRCDVVLAIQTISDPKELDPTTEGLLIIDTKNQQSVAWIPTGDENNSQDPIQMMVEKHGLKQYDKLYKMILHTSIIHP